MVCRTSESRIIRMEIAEIITSVDDYKSILNDHGVTLTNFYLACNYEVQTTSLNLLVLAPDNIDYLHLFDSLRIPHPVRTISLANQVGKAPAKCSVKIPMNRSILP